VLVTDNGFEVLTLGSRGGTSPFVAGEPYLLDEEAPSAPRPSPGRFSRGFRNGWLKRKALRRLSGAAEAGSRRSQGAFLREESVDALVHARPQLVDAVLREVCRVQFGEQQQSWSLVAVGGYGRAELHPCSDIDLLLLVPAPLDSQAGSRVEQSSRSCGHRPRGRPQRPHYRRVRAGERSRRRSHDDADGIAADLR